MKTNILNPDLASLHRNKAHDNNHKGNQIKDHNEYQESSRNFVYRFLVKLGTTYFYIKFNLHYASTIDKGRPKTTTTKQNKL